MESCQFGARGDGFIVSCSSSVTLLFELVLLQILPLCSLFFSFVFTCFPVLLSPFQGS